MSESFDLDRPDHFTAGAVGAPGQRVFYLQAREGRTLVTLKSEKEQVRALGEYLSTLLERVPDAGDPRPASLALHEPVQALRDRAGRLASDLARAGLDARAIESDAVVGGGGAPGVRLASAAVSLPATLAASLRKNKPPVTGRVEDGRLLLDLRTVDPADDDLLREAVLGAAAQGQDAAGP